MNTETMVRETSAGGKEWMENQTLKEATLQAWVLQREKKIKEKAKMS